MTTPSDPRTLTQVKQYRFVRELGHGGMGTVYEAIDNRDGGRVAVKLLHPWLAAEDSSFRDRFEREAHIAALLRSPYSVRLLDFGVAEDTYFLVMEYVEGTTVGSELENGPLEPVRALRIAIDVARALEEATARGVIHRDIKPDNILLTRDGRVKVTDFGIARQEGGTGLTSAGRFVGTAEYAAPEQAVGEADHRSDVYSLGATLYCMLTGHPPFQAGSVWDLLRLHQTEPVPMEPLAGMPDFVCNPIRRCMEKDPRDRYQTATELAGALERALAAMLHSAQTTRAPHPAPPPAVPVPGVSQPPVSGATRVATPAQPAPAGGTRVAAAPAAVDRVPMAAVPTGQAGDVSHFELTITNPSSSPLRLTLMAVEPSGLLSVVVPTPVMLGASEIKRLPVEVRQLRPAPRGTRTLQFQVAAARDDGTRIGFVNVTAIPAAAAGGGTAGSARWLLIGGGAVVVAAAMGGAFLFMNSGGGNGGATPTPQVTSVVTPGGKSIQASEPWQYAFTVTGNDCSFGAPVGDPYSVAFRFKPASGTGTVVNEGDPVAVIGIQDKEIPIGTFTFHFVDFEFSYPVAASSGQRGTATVRTTFADATTIKSASLTERYESTGCTITGQSSQ